MVSEFAGGRKSVRLVQWVYLKSALVEHIGGVMKSLLGLLLIVFMVGCAGKEGPMGPQGPEGDTANINELQARVDSLEALITYALGGSPETEDPLKLGEQTTFGFVANKLGSESTNLLTDTRIRGELQNTGDYDAVDVKITFTIRKSGIRVDSASRTLGTIRAGEARAFSFVLDGRPREFERADYVIEYAGGPDKTGSLQIEQL
jgi:hypothetical protein